MAGLDEQLVNWYKSVVDATELSTDDQIKVNHAGAEVFAKALADRTRKLHYSNRKGVKHLADLVAVTDRNVDGKKDGSVTVGFTQKSQIARFLNDGTRKMQADHYIDHLRDEITDEVAEAQAKVFKQIGGDRK